MNPKHMRIDGSTAYFMLGVANWLARNEIDSGRWGGQFGFVEAVTEFEPIIRHLWDEYGKHNNGGFDYEVSEPFGEAVAEAMHETTDRAEARVRIRKSLTAILHEYRIDNGDDADTALKVTAEFVNVAVIRFSEAPDRAWP